MSLQERPIPFADPSWINNANPLYNETHRAWRDTVRAFVDKEIMPYRDEWDLAGKFPDELFRKAGQIGLLAAAVGWPEDLAPVPRPKGYDSFFSMIAMDELCRTGSGGLVWGLVGGLGIGSHPIIHSDNEPLRSAIMKPALRGEVKVCLAVSEAQAGSDVANLTTTADEEGDNLRINGNKKWITGSNLDGKVYATVAVKLQDGSKGFAAIRLVLVPLDTKGVTVKAMKCTGAHGSGTGFIEFDDVVVPKANILGDASVLLRNFVGERLGIAVQANRFARVCLTETIEHIRRRRAFGKLLVEQPVVRYKVALMMKEIECTQAWIESLIARLRVMEAQDADWFDSVLKLGAEASLVKVKATEVFEMSAREASLIVGGQSYVVGNRVENLMRSVVSLLIPGGSVDVLLDSAARLALQGKL